jgi:hypothetical protein
MKLEIEIPTSELRVVLPGLSKVASRPGTAAACIRVSVDHGQIHLAAHGLDEYAIVRLAAATSAPDGAILVPLSDLTKFGKARPAVSHVRLIGDAASTVIQYPVAGSDFEESVEHFPVKDWPETRVFDGDPVLLDEPFKQALEEALGCASEDASRYVLQGACLDVNDPKAHYVVGTDGRQLYAANSFTFDLQQPLIVPTRRFLTWPGFQKDGVWQLRVLPPGTEETLWFEIKSDRWTYATRRVDGVYPNWKAAIPVSTGPVTKILIPESAGPMLLGAVPMLPGCREDYFRIALEVRSGQLLIKGRQNEQSPWRELPIPGCEISGADVETHLNREHFLRALRLTLREINISDALSAIVFRAEKKTLVVVPLRMSGTSATPLPASAPSAREVSPNPTTEIERKPVSKETLTPPTRGNLTATTPAPETGAAIDQLVEQVERIKTSLRQVLTELSQTSTLLRQAARERRLNEKEIESVRAKIRSLQSVEI